MEPRILEFEKYENNLVTTGQPLFYIGCRDLHQTIVMKAIRAVAIDDVGDILELIEYNLNKEGIEVDPYTESNEALKDIFRNPPDIVICDWMMPAPDGLEVVKTIKSNDLTKKIPLIMLTCKGSIHDYKEAIRAGAEDYVVKPVRMEELIRRIKLLLPDHSRRVNIG